MKLGATNGAESHVDLHVNYAVSKKLSN
jgi:hypothetical protein